MGRKPRGPALSQNFQRGKRPFSGKRRCLAFSSRTSWLGPRAKAPRISCRTILCAAAFIITNQPIIYKRQFHGRRVFPAAQLIYAPNGGIMVSVAGSGYRPSAAFPAKHIFESAQPGQRQNFAALPTGLHRRQTPRALVLPMAMRGRIRARSPVSLSCPASLLSAYSPHKRTHKTRQLSLRALAFR